MDNPMIYVPIVVLVITMLVCLTEVYRETNKDNKRNK